MIFMRIAIDDILVVERIPRHAANRFLAFAVPPTLAPEIMRQSTSEIFLVKEMKCSAFVLHMRTCKETST